MLLSEAFELYKQDVIVFKNQSFKTEEHHFVTCKSLVSFFGDVQIEELSFEHVRQWKVYLDAGRSPKTVRGYIIKLRVVLAYLRANGIVVLDPERIPIPKAIDRAPLCLTSEEVQLFINSTSRIKNKAIISLLYASGLRVSELCNLNRDQIKPDCTFTVTGKGGKTRLCFIDDRSCQFIKEYLDTREDDNPALFTSEWGGRITPSIIQHSFKFIRKRSGLQSVHPHTLRHSFATNLMRNGMHIYTLARLMGHNSIQTTQIYLSVTDPQLREDYLKYHSV